MIHRAETSRGTLAVGLAVLLATCALGCDGAQGRTGTNLAPPIAPSRNEALADRWYHAWEKQEDVVADSEVRDMFFVLGTRGRDWRKPEGPDGYPVRVFLLDGLGRPIRAEGALHAFLVSSPLPRIFSALDGSSSSPARTNATASTRSPSAKASSNVAMLMM